MFICPLCNGLSRLELSCPLCGAQLEDQGFLGNYYGPYSPYEDEKNLDRTDGVGPGQCIHLFSCPVCGYDHRLVINSLDKENQLHPLDRTRP